MQIEGRLNRCIWRLFSNAITVVIGAVFHLVACSVLVPAVSLVLVGLLLTWTTKRLVSLTTAIQNLEDSSLCFSDNFNYQLLMMIKDFRRYGTVSKLRSKQKAHADSALKAYTLSEIQLTNFACRIGWLLFLFYSSLLTVSYLNQLKLGFVTFIPRSSLMTDFSILYAFRAASSLWQLPQETLAFIKAAHNCAKLSLLKASPKAPTKEKTTLQKRSQLDYSAPIIFKNVSLTLGYAPVLKGISVKFEVGDITGIYAVEGTGRSILFELILRIQQRNKPEKSGIFVFGKQIEELDEDVIKKEIFLIDKNPILMKGTIKENLDPYCIYSTEELVDKLRSFELDYVFSREFLRGEGIFADDLAKDSVSIGVPQFAKSHDTENGASLPQNSKLVKAGLGSILSLRKCRFE